jgi:TorA maturation chaperone TorD
MLVREVLAALGIESNAEGPGGRLPLDHAGLLFEIAARAVAETNEATRAIAGPLEEQLFGRAWQGFGRAIERQAREPLYRALGRLISEIHT